MNLLASLKGRALRWSLPLPFQCRHIEYSTIASVDDDASQPSERLLDISIEAIRQARHIDLSWLCQRMSAPPYYPNVWPGEHYKLLAALALVLKPRRVIEIGTFQGLSALALKGSLPPEGEVITVDIVPWQQIHGSSFRPSDFEDGRLRQVIGDLANREFFAKFEDTLTKCDVLFVDAPKNVIFERTLIQHLSGIRLPDHALVLFDDIRQWNMLEIWRKIDRPKLDLTSFGHWTGTGIVDWNAAVVPKGNPRR
jgi:predicted O-methyltransferase YrrM